ncbi:hypothetical protein [Streptomyces sp. NPDC058308]
MARGEDRGFVGVRGQDAALADGLLQLPYREGLSGSARAADGEEEAVPLW